MKHALSVLGAAVLWGTSYAMIKSLMGTMGAVSLALVRFAIAFAALSIVISVADGRKGGKFRTAPLPREAYPSIALGGLFGYALYNACQNFGIKQTTATEAALLVALYPVITALAEARRLGQRISARYWLGVAISVAGVAMVIDLRALAATSSLSHLYGNLLIVLGGVVWAAYNVSLKKSDTHLDILKVTRAQILAGALFTLPMVLVEPFSLARVQPSGWAAIGYLGVMCSTVGFLLYIWGLKGIEARQAVNILNLVPVVGVLVATAFLGETMSLVQISGGITVMVGVAVSLTQPRASQPQVQAAAAPGSPTP